MNGIQKPPTVYLTVPTQPRPRGMPRIQLTKGMGGIPKDLWRADSFKHGKQRMGCLARLHLFEENARFVLLGLLLVIYLLCGARFFQHLESEREREEKQQYKRMYKDFLHSHCRKKNRTTCRAELDGLLAMHGNLSAAGLMYDRPRWDFAGSFYFVGTIISTIGFGMTTPRTVEGKVATILYGFFGCASCILFFNLFLERTVTALAYFLRWVHSIKERYRTRRAGESAARAALSIAIRREFDDISATTQAETAPWRPSVYKVFVCLLLFAIFWISVAASIYRWIEGWSYLDAVYFCFVGFATIGFGDFVSSQQAHVDDSVLCYRVANAVFLSIGCCCIYSLFNVTSVVLRQFLNFLIRKLDVRCKRPKCLRKKKQRYVGLGLRPPPDEESESESAEEGHSGPPSDGIISLKEFLEHNKASMLMMQEHIIKQSRVQAVQNESNQISANSVGPLGILDQKFGNNDDL